MSTYETRVIPFHGSHLRVKVERDGVWVAIRPICEHLGLDIARQMIRIQDDASLHLESIRITNEAGYYVQSNCLSLPHALTWLHGLDYRRIAPAIRPILTAYKTEMQPIVTQLTGDTMNTETSATSDTAIIPFHGSALRVREQDGQVFVAVRPICEHLGIAWQPQSAKLISDERFNCHDIVMVAEDGKQREMTALPQDQLLGWLYTINPNKVKPAVRPLLLAYQKETTRAINDYWTKGQATRPRSESETGGNPFGLTALKHVIEEFESQNQRISTLEKRLDNAPISGTHIREIYELGQRLGQLMGNYHQAWALFKNRFHLASYRDLPESRFDEGLAFLRAQIVAYSGQPEYVFGGRPDYAQKSA